jgi:hypothetical protein
MLSPLVESALQTTQPFFRDSGASPRVQEHYNVVENDGQLAAILETGNKMCFRVRELAERDITEVDGSSTVGRPHVIFGRVVHWEYLSVRIDLSAGYLKPLTKFKRMVERQISQDRLTAEIETDSFIPKVAAPKQAPANFEVLGIQGAKRLDTSGAMVQTKIADHAEGHATIQPCL